MIYLCFLKYGKITVFLVNLFEATISHLIPLIVNELNLATVYYIWKWETPWTHWYIFLTLTLFIQFLLRSRLFHRQRIELCPRIYILQLESRDSVTYVHIQTYFWPYHCSINSFHVQRVLSPDCFQNPHHDNILSFLFTPSDYIAYTYCPWWHR